MQHFKYLVVLIFSIRFVFGDGQWYTAADGNNYWIDPEYNYNWYDSVIACASRNLTLATITTDAKNKALIDVLKQSGKNHYWIGGVGTAASGQRSFYWITTGEKFDYSYWWVGEPNGNGVENCVHIDGYDYHWNDNNCATNNFALLCEENPRDADIREELNTRRIYIVGLNDVLESLLENAKLSIDNILSNIISLAQQTQNEMDDALAI